MENVKAILSLMSQCIMMENSLGVGSAALALNTRLAQKRDVLTIILVY